jgi:hypothetical protein
MTRVIIGPDVWASLAAIKAPTQLCDEAGRVLGYFTPVADKSLYEKVQPPISDEELQRRRQEKGGRTLAEILADLESRA